MIAEKNYQKISGIPFSRTLWYFLTN